jgi:hypothetical protein
MKRVGQQSRASCSTDRSTDAGLSNHRPAMKVVIATGAFLLALGFAAACNGAQITNTLSLGGVPAGLHCNGTWTNQGVVLSFTETLASEGYTDGFCVFGIQPAFVSLYPCRLRLDLTGLTGSVSGIEVTITDMVGPNATKLFAYSGAQRIAEAGNAAAGLGVIALDFGSARPDMCAVSSYEAKVHSVRVVVEQDSRPLINIRALNGSIILSWTAIEETSVLEWTADLAGRSSWTPQTNGIEVQAGEFVYRCEPNGETRLFRLRR